MVFYRKISQFWLICIYLPTNKKLVVMYRALYRLQCVTGNYYKLIYSPVRTDCSSLQDEGHSHRVITKVNFAFDTYQRGQSLLLLAYRYWNSTGSIKHGYELTNEHILQVSWGVTFGILKLSCGVGCWVRRIILLLLILKGGSAWYFQVNIYNYPLFSTKGVRPRRASVIALGNGLEPHAYY